MRVPYTRGLTPHAHAQGPVGNQLSSPFPDFPIAPAARAPRAWRRWLGARGPSKTVGWVTVSSNSRRPNSEGPAVVPQPAGPGEHRAAWGRLKTLASHRRKAMRERNAASFELFRCEGHGATAKRKAQLLGTAEPTSAGVWGGEIEQTLALASRGRCCGETPKRRNGSNGGPTEAGGGYRASEK